ncbi:hypothetical protein OAD15_05495 [Hyphomicrobiales bacterium]|nr:hypothetical protein [Hyphomicrobiales bacterium]
MENSDILIIESGLDKIITIPLPLHGELKMRVRNHFGKNEKELTTGILSALVILRVFI